MSSLKLERIKIFDISPDFFYPKPKVWSSVILLKPKLNFRNIEKIKNLEHITNLFFNQRRKMIKKPMKQLFTNFEDIAKELEIDLNSRPQNLSLNKYIEICKLYENLT